MLTGRSVQVYVNPSHRVGSRLKFQSENARISPNSRDSESGSAQLQVNPSQVGPIVRGFFADPPEGSAATGAAAVAASGAAGPRPSAAAAPRAASGSTAGCRHMRGLCVKICSEVAPIARARSSALCAPPAPAWPARNPRHRNPVSARHRVSPRQAPMRPRISASVRICGSTCGAPSAGK